MTFEQTLAITIVALIISGSAFLMWFARDSYRQIGTVSIIVLCILLLATESVNSIYSAGAGTQWLRDSLATTKATYEVSRKAQTAFLDVSRAVVIPKKQGNELIAALPNASPPDLKRVKAPFQSWVFETLGLLIAAQFVLFVIYAVLEIRSIQSSSDLPDQQDTK